MTPVVSLLPRALALLAAVLTAVGSAGASTAARPLAFAGAAEVSSEGVFLDQILASGPVSPLPRIRVTNAPPAGEVASITRAQLNDWLRDNAPDLASTNWVGIDRVQIRRRMRSLDEIELRDLLTAALQEEVVKSRGELELRLTRAWTSIPVPDEPISLRIVDLPATGPSAFFIARFELWCGEERLGNWQVSASAKIWREVPVAEATLRRGQLLATAPIIYERRDILALRGEVGSFELDDASLELVENVPAGHPVLARSVRPRPVVLRGQLADAVMLNGGLQISLKVEALQDGLPGQIIRVRNPKTRRELAGKVLNEQTILIAW
jgi:flagella basal body P-ring formation protein FlgA